MGLIPFFYEVASNRSFTGKDFRLSMECSFIVNWYYAVVFEDTPRNAVFG
jgi:hypothetical protein